MGRLHNLCSYNFYYRPLLCRLLLRNVTTKISRTRCSSVQHVLGRQESCDINANHPRRYFSEKAKNNYLITTPIFYVNAEPHIGHLYSAVLADAASRWHRVCGAEVTFSTGTDEHGLKIQQAAEKEKENPQKFCDTVSEHFRRLFTEASVEYTDYIRTTEDRHKSMVNHFWNILTEGGYIYRGVYEGWYSISDEAFLTPDEVMEKTDSNGHKTMVALDSGNPVEWMKEDNYMFRLSQFEDQLLKWLDSGAVQPAVFESLVRQWITEDLPDLSVSRQSERLSWGIPVPNDASQTIYVWLDALTNYLTVSRYPSPGHCWPADCHVVGKDILRFHAVYWPAFLIAAGLDPPRKVFCHSHWTLDHLKMSKSRGNVVDPFNQLSLYTTDGLRYFLLSEGVPHSDGNYSERRLVECLNSQLSNTLGNLLSRCTSSSLNPRQEFPSFQPDIFQHIATAADQQMVEHLKKLPEIVSEHYESLHFYKGIEWIMSQLRDTNRFVQHHMPWKLKTMEDKESELNVILSVTLETLRVSAILLQPAIPELSTKIFSRLNIPADERHFCSALNCLENKITVPLGHDVGNLFPRIKVQ